MMKKILVWSVMLVVVILVVVVIGGSFYMLDYSLSPDPNRTDTAFCFREQFKNYPETRPWVDSLRRVGALRDTFVTMASGECLHALFVRRGSQKTAIVVHGWRDCSIDFLYLARLYERELGYNVVMPDIHAHGLSEGDMIRMGWLDRKDMMHWLSMQSTWQHEEMLITADQFTGMGNGDRVYRIYFHWRNTSHSNNPPAAVDHIELRAVSCPKPQNVAVSGVGDHAATVSWTGNANQYGVIVEAGGITTYQTTTDTFLVLQNLPSATTCEVTVRALCGTDSSMLSQPVSFVTTISSHDLPYFTDFSAGQDWQMVNGTCANYWTNGVTNSGQNALFVTNDGITEGYRTTSASTVMAENFFTMPATDSVYVEFDLRIGGESTWDYLKAFLAPIHVEYVAGATPNTQSPNTYATYAMDFTAFKSQTGSSTSYPYILNLTDGETVHVGTYMANPAPNGQAKFVFLWRNDAISGEQPGAVVTNFYMAEMAPTTCASPTNLTYALDADDHTSVTLTWQHEGTSVINWQIDYRQITEEVWSSVTTANTTYTLTDLDPNMDYEAHVVAHCPNGLTSDASNTVIFHTDNDGIDDYLSKMVTLYPNPATETVIVAASDANITITGVEVYNVYGQNVETFHGTSPHNRTTINVSNLSAGLYHVRITTDSGVVTKKLVKR